MKRSLICIFSIILLAAFSGCDTPADDLASAGGSDCEAALSENADLKAENQQLREDIGLLTLQVEKMRNTIDEMQDETTGSVPEENPRFIEAAENDPSGEKAWTILSSFDYDFDADGQSETVSLFTSALRDINGTIMWDEGQDWLLLIRDDTLFYPLFNDYLQMGGVFFNVSMMEGKTVPTVSIVTATGSGMSITDVTYNAGEEAYEAAAVYDAGVLNRMFSSVPDYR